jgi:hypothetical protein
MDPLGIDKAVGELNSSTLPQLVAEGNTLVSRLEALVDRLDGATITITIKLGAKAA